MPAGVRALTPPPRWPRDGLQLVAAVLAAYAISAALGLPESLWAVMSVLIVVRPTTGATVGAGWDRIRGTVAGSIVALGGVWLYHQAGLAARPVTLSLVALLAFASAWRPAMRSAPIAALIVLNSGGIPGLSAMHVAALRAIEVAIGVATGLAVSWLDRGSRAAGRFDSACAQRLRDMAASLVQSPEEADAERARIELRRLGELAVSADREQRWHRASRDRRDHRTIARLVARTSHDVAVFPRLRAMRGGNADEGAWESLFGEIAAALESTAMALEGAGPQDTSMLDRGLHEPATAAAAPALRLLRQDLVGLARLLGRA